MRAVVFNEVGDPQQVLQIADVEPPEPMDGHCLVKVDARPIEPADMSFIRGQYRIRPAFPQIAGLEGLGKVVKGLPGTPFAAGMRVAFRSPGSWAELAVVPVGRLIAVPDDITDLTGSQIALNPLTAWALLDECKAARGDCILLTAATSTVSNLVASIAQSRGIQTIGLVRGDVSQKARRSKAIHLISVDDPQMLARIKDAAGASRVSALLDSVGGPSLAALLSSLTPGAHIVAYGVQDPRPATITNAMLIYSNLTWKGFGIDRWLSLSGPNALSQALQQLWNLIRDKTIELPVASTHPLEDIKHAIAADGQPGRSGKVVLI
jgi:NADPH2:quinone reductase